ncbi:MAG: hypothetical protein PHV37_07460 [Candidatus Gastranaerophilales bacterium]|nr:hypothetical protein [Candidatus Gastranaerophilales bacterium]
MTVEKLELQEPIVINGAELKVIDYDISKIGVAEIGKAEIEKSKIFGRAAITNLKVAQADYLLHCLLGMQAIIACNPNIDMEDLKRIKGYDMVQVAAIGTRFFVAPTKNEQIVRG